MSSKINKSFYNMSIYFNKNLNKFSHLSNQTKTNLFYVNVLKKLSESLFNISLLSSNTNTYIHL